MATTPRSILVVDDNPEICEWMLTALLDVGHKVTCAADGAEALEVVKNDTFDVVITDIVMPNRDGYEVIAELRKNAPGTRIIVIAGDGRGSRDGYLDWGRGLGANAALGKPFGVAELMAALATALNSSAPGHPA